MTVRAEKTGFWRSRYEISVDDRPVATFDGTTWKGGGTFTVRDQQTYRVVARKFGSRYELCRMLDADGTLSEPLAVAERVGRKEWSITEADGTDYRFRRRSFWGSEQDLLGPDGTSAGEVRRLSAWRGGALAELPRMHEALQVFVVAVVICMWDSQTAAAASASGGG